MSLWARANGRAERRTRTEPSCNPAGRSPDVATPTTPRGGPLQAMAAFGPPEPRGLEQPVGSDGAEHASASPALAIGRWSTGRENDATARLAGQRQLQLAGRGTAPQPTHRAGASAPRRPPRRTGATGERHPQSGSRPRNKERSPREYRAAARRKRQAAATDSSVEQGPEVEETTRPPGCDRSCLRDESPKERSDRDQRREGNGKWRRGTARSPRPWEQRRRQVRLADPERTQPDQATTPATRTATGEGKTPKGVAPVGKSQVLPTRPTPRRRDDEHPSGSPEARRRGGAANSLPKGKPRRPSSRRAPRGDRVLGNGRAEPSGAMARRRRQVQGNLEELAADGQSAERAEHGGSETWRTP